MGAERNGKPRVLLIHGLLSTHVVWGPLMDELENDAVMVAPDLVGHGSAPMPAGRYSLDEAVDHLEPVIDEHRPTHIVGHSMGGIIALALLSRHPQAFERVGIVGLPVYGNETEAREFIHRHGRLAQGFLRNHYVAHSACAIAERTGLLWQPIARRRAPNRRTDISMAFFDHCNEAHHGAMRNVVFAGHAPVLGRSVQTPVTLVHGTADRAAPIGAARDLAASLDWNFAEIEGGRHQLMLERTEAVAQWVRREVLLTDAGPAAAG